MAAKELEEVPGSPAWDSEGEAMSTAIETIGEFLHRGSPGEEPQWYAIQTRPRFEKKAAAELVRRGITAFLPTVRESRQWSDRTKMIDFPMFPGYLFVRVVPDSRIRVAVGSVSGVVGFVGINSKPSAIAAREIEAIQHLVVNNIPIEGEPFLKLGQRVRVIGGALNGLEGVVVGTRGKRRLVISISTIERSVSVSIEGYGLEVIR